jgi:hypothetical protein
MAMGPFAAKFGGLEERRRKKGELERLDVMSRGLERMGITSWWHTMMEMRVDGQRLKRGGP